MALLGSKTARQFLLINLRGSTAAMAYSEESPDKGPLQLDRQTLEAIIEGVASKLQKEITRDKPGQHSRTSGSSGKKGE